LKKSASKEKIYEERNHFYSHGSHLPDGVPKEFKAVITLPKRGGLSGAVRA
jgi:hypothetical protein